MVIRCLHVKAHADDSPHAGPKLSGRISGIGHCPVGYFQHEKVLKQNIGDFIGRNMQITQFKRNLIDVSAGKIRKTQQGPGNRVAAFPAAFRAFSDAGFSGQYRFLKGP